VVLSLFLSVILQVGVEIPKKLQLIRLSDITEDVAEEVSRYDSSLSHFRYVMANSKGK
jgi:hypothetical protein